MAFVHLHNRTQYSLLDGAMRPAELVNRVAELGMTAVAVTDSGNLYCAVEFTKAAKSAGIHPVLGAELWMWPDGLDSIEPAAPDGGWNLVFLVQDATGYHNLCKLVTSAIFDGMHWRPRIDWNLLERHREGLVVLTGGLHGVLGRAVKPDGVDAARADLVRLAELLGAEHLFVELQDYGLADQPALVDAARRLAGELGLRTVVTNDCRYLCPEDAVTLDLLNSIARGTHLDDPNRPLLLTDQQYVKSEEEMRALFPDDGPALDRTAEIADRCRFEFNHGTYYFPATDPPDPPEVDPRTGQKTPRDTDANWAYFYRAFPPPRDFGMPDPDVEIPPRPPGAGHIDGYFEWYARKGLDLRLRQIPPERHGTYRERLEYEIDIIEQMGFPAYLLIVAEFINWAKDHGIPVGPGRGSGAGSLVNWAMRITEVDPLQFGLLFERFLNPERVSMPDIDVDFCQDRREEVIEHVRQKYGSQRVSQIITYGRLQAKAALKDVARVLGLDFKQADRIAKLVPNDLNIKLDQAVEQVERFKNLAQGDPLVGRIVALARRIEGMTRQTGVHAAGVVIADRPLVEHAPLYRDGPDSGPVIQYDMKNAEWVGLIKFDFLGLKTLDQIRDTVEMVARNTGERIDLHAIPLDDPETFDLLQRGDTFGVFQLESSGMRDLLGRLRPSTIDDLIALMALYRPGPLSSGMVDKFIDCKHGRTPIEYPHPDLKPILESTYGSIVYQEQVMQIAQVYSGYTLGGADLLRRAMGKKKPEEMARQRDLFVAGAVKKGHSENDANKLFDRLAFFAGYGFNKSHSAAYSIISYHTAWLKAHYRAEYMAALMSIEAGNTKKLLPCISDCKRAGIEILPPDVNESQATFDVPKDRRNAIRFGLAAVKGVGEGAVQCILQARREAGGRFASFMDCLERIDYRKVNKKVLENLIGCGAFDWTGLPRRAMFEGLAGAVDGAQSLQERKASGQRSLFGSLPAAAAPEVRLPNVGEWPTAVKLGHEREALGFYVSGNPLDSYRGIIERHTTCRLEGLDRLEGDSEVTVAGMVAEQRENKTRRGGRMGFVTLEDLRGSVECLFFPDAWTRSKKVIESEQPVLVRGKLEKREDGYKILAESAELLADVRERRTREVHLYLDIGDLVDGRVEALRDLLERSRGTCPVHLHLRLPGRAWTWLKLPCDLWVSPDDALLQGLESLFRRPDVARLT